MSNGTPKIYPNPVVNELNIDNINGDLTLVLIADFMGKNFMVQHLSSGRNTVDVTALPAGIYLLHLTGTSKAEIQNFLKQ